MFQIYGYGLGLAFAACCTYLFVQTMQVAPMRHAGQPRSDKSFDIRFSLLVCCLMMVVGNTASTVVFLWQGIAQ